MQFYIKICQSKSSTDKYQLLFQCGIRHIILNQHDETNNRGQCRRPPDGNMFNSLLSREVNNFRSGNGNVTSFRSGNEHNLRSDNENVTILGVVM